MDDQKNSEYARPRRPSPESVSYLSDLPLDEHLAAKQAREYVAHLLKIRSDGEEQKRASQEEMEPPEYPSMLSVTHAALSSIFREFASLACEEIPSQQLETLVRISCRYSLIAKRVVLAGMTSYWTFLSTHRFGSHVAQTVLRCVVADCEVNLDNFDDGQDQNEGRLVTDGSYGSLLQNEDGSGGIVPHCLRNLLLQSINELKLYATELAMHVCGSHVLRTSLCILSGVEFLDAFSFPGSNGQQKTDLGDWETGNLAATRRGKIKDKKKKNKKRGGNVTSTDDEGGRSHQEYTVMMPIVTTPELGSDHFINDAEKLFDEIVMIVSRPEGVGCQVQQPGTLQEQTCHSSAGPLLIQMLRLLSFRDCNPKRVRLSNDVISDRRLVILPKEPQYNTGSQAEELVHRLLCWDKNIISTSTNNSGSDSTLKQPYAGDIIYGLSGEPRGSILLETIFRCCPDNFHDELCHVGGFYDVETLREYIQHNVSNFVVQTILVSVRDKLQISRLVKCLCGLVEDGSFLSDRPLFSQNHAEDASTKVKPKNTRMGVVWRAFEMCASKGSLQDQEQILFALMRGYASVTSTILQGGDVTKDDVTKRKKRSRAKGLPAEGCIPLLLGLSPGTYEGEGDNSRLTLDTAGARTLYHILNFKERLRMNWATAIVQIYGRDDLVKIANDGLGSRCVIDPLLDGPSSPTSSKLLAKKLSGRLSFLAAERVGYHTVTKLFLALPTLEEKAAISAELSHFLNRLGGNSMGRSTMVKCAVKEYLEGESVWRAALAKQQAKEDWMKEILGNKTDNSKADDELPRTKKKQKKEKG